MAYCDICGKDIYDCLAHRILNPREPYEVHVPKDGEVNLYDSKPEGELE